MSTRAPGLGVAGIVIGADRRLLLALRAHPPAAGLWAFPGGRVELGEGLEDALRRELREECGIEVEIIDRFDIVEAIGPGPAPVPYHWVIVQYRVRPAPGARPRAGDDAAALRWLTLEEIRALPRVPGLAALAARALAD